MKTKEMVVIPETQEERVVKVTCDLCDSEIKNKHCYDVDDVTIKWDSGSHYPEGRFVERYSIDMCSSCFESKLTPWLESQGAKVQIKGLD